MRCPVQSISLLTSLSLLYDALTFHSVLPLVLCIYFYLGIYMCFRYVLPTHNSFFRTEVCHFPSIFICTWNFKRTSYILTLFTHNLFIHHTPKTSKNLPKSPPNPSLSFLSISVVPNATSYLNPCKLQINN